MNKFWEYFKDVDGQKSSKRLITFTALIMFIITWAVDLFTKLSASEYMVESLMWMIAAGLGTIVVEKFSRKKADVVEEGPHVDIDLSDAPDGE